jgi:hypothetical protein
MYEARRKLIERDSLDTFDVDRCGVAIPNTRIVQHRSGRPVTLTKTWAAFVFGARGVESCTQALCPILSTHDIVANMSRGPTLLISFEQRVERRHTVCLGWGHGQPVRYVAQGSPAHRTGGILDCVKRREKQVPLCPGGVTTKNDPPVERFRQTYYRIDGSGFGLGGPVEHGTEIH